MILAYFDESGDPGRDRSPSRYFALSAILIDENQWLSTLDSTIGFRRFLLSNFGVKPRAELKAQSIIRGTDGLAGIPPQLRYKIYAAALRFQEKVGTIRTFAVVIDKENLAARYEPREYAWARAIERLERYGSSVAANIKVLPDEGHGLFIRRKIRQMRRHHVASSAYGGAGLIRPAQNIIEDSSDRDSRESYFIQFADLNAYAAVRHVSPNNRLSAKYWELLGVARVAEVSKIHGGPTGIVKRP